MNTSANSPQSFPGRVQNLPLRAKIYSPSFQDSPESSSTCLAPPKVSQSRIHPALIAVLALVSGIPALDAASNRRYLETDMVSDVPGLAAVTDANLVNPWGLSRSATSAWWVADNGTGLSTLYTGVGAKLGLVVTVPPAAGQLPPGAPTGTVFNGSADFQVGPNQPARFLFSSEDGTISGWNPGTNPTVAINKVEWPGQAIYKGLALGQIAGANYLYAANFHAGTVDVFDKNFAPVNLGPTAFRDKHLPKNYAPFNVQAIGDFIYVAFAKQDEEKIDEISGRGRGFVDVFTTSGVLQSRLQWGPWMNAPWGLALAPADFGRYSNRILVGQFGSGKIAAFDPVSGRFVGLLRNAHGRSLVIPGLWALSFGNGASAGPLNTLYFTAGIDDEAHGLFGSLTFIAPEPKKHEDDDDHDEDDQ